ncbi:ABC-2 type transport system permease protein [Catenulispora sp. MAP5-51]|uniref:ABC transporter permease n=1 Tax=Catenulispora sp. MAP5-51 TaxID=3156298 RepID=UPI00351475BC
MTTATVTRITPVDRARSPIPFGRLVRTELRKLTDTRAGRWLLLTLVAATPIVAAVMVGTMSAKDLNYAKFVDFTSTPEKLLLPILGILTMTSEWSQRTGLTTFVLEPKRGRVLTAKVVAALALGAGLTALMLLTSVAGNLLGIWLRGGHGSWAFAGQVSGEVTLVLISWLLLGMALGMALLVTAAAILVAFVVPNMFSAFFGSGSKDKTAWFDLNQAQSPLYSHDITGKDWIQLLTASALWIGVPMVLGVMRVRRTEVK